jgi:acetylornithine deacetylase/succinyl-diaminopimelate desuccinylase-like protein
MTPAHAIDTQRLSTLAHEYEREILQFFRDLLAVPGDNGHSQGLFQRIRHEVEKAPYEEIRVDAAGNLLARIGSGNHKVMLHAQGGTAGASGAAGIVYAGRLIHELGMYDDFTLWVASSVDKESRSLARIPALERGGLRPDAVLLAQPTNLCIQMREAAVEGFLSESHPLVQAAISTYETLFELPPMVIQSPSATALVGIPAIAFGAGEDGASPQAAEPLAMRHLLKAAQFYAAFPIMYVDAMKRQ